MITPIVKLKNMCEFVRGLTYSKKDELEFSKTAVLRATNIDLASNKLNLDEIRYISNDVNIRSDKKVKLNDILICTASGSKSHLGKVALIEEELDMAFGGFMGVLRVKPNVDARYLYNYLTSDTFLKHVANLGDGANINNLKFSQIEDLEIALPSLEVQKKIVNKISTISNQIEIALTSAENNIKNAEALLQSYLLEVFRKEFSESKLTEIQSVCKLLNGYAFKSTESIASSNTQLLRMGNLYGNNLDLTRNSVYYPDSFKQEYSKFIVKQGDILISLTGTVGKQDYGYAVRVEELPVDLLLNQRLLKIYEINSSVVNPDYFLYFLHSNIFLDELYKSANGTRQANLSSDHIKKMKIPLCSIANQDLYVKKISKIKEECLLIKNSSKNKIENLILLKQSILQQAFSGELVRE